MSRIPIIGEKDTPVQRKKQTVPYEHQQIIDQFLKLIADCDMSDTLKMVMRMKIWGIRPNKFYPMTEHQIAYVLVKDNIIFKRRKESTMQELERYLKTIDVLGPGYAVETAITEQAVQEVQRLLNEAQDQMEAHLVRCSIQNIEYRFEKKHTNKIDTWLGQGKRIKEI